MELFEYEGLEWFNVATGSLLFALVALTQLFWCIANPSQLQYWSYMAVYFAGFTLIALALITKKPFTSICAVVVSLFFVINDMWHFLGTPLGTSPISTSTIELIRTFTAVIALVLLTLGISDFLFDWTKIDVKLGNIPIIASFSFTLIWALLRLTGTLTFGSMGRESIEFATAIALNLLLIPFFIVSILAMLSEIKERWIPVETQTLNNIAFLIASIGFLVILIRWYNGGLMRLFS